MSTFLLPKNPYNVPITGLKIAVITAEWNGFITSVLKDGAVTHLLEQGITKNQIITVQVPGSFELPLAAKLLANKGVNAIICLGCIIEGDTAHFEYVSKAATDGIMQVGQQTNIPVIFGVLTTHTKEQALERAGGTHGNKGKEAAQTALWMLGASQHIQNLDFNL